MAFKDGGWKKNDEDQNYLDSRKIDNGWQIAEGEVIII